MALFGAGLLGTSVLCALLRSTSARIEKFPFGWNAGDPQSDQVRAITARIITLARETGRGGASPQIDIVWTAGKAGFLSAKR